MASPRDRCPTTIRLVRTYDVGHDGWGNLRVDGPYTHRVEVAFDGRCWSLRCPSCGWRRRIEIRKHIQAELDRPDRIGRLLSLTFDPAVHDYRSDDPDAWKAVNRAFSRLVQAIRRQPWARPWHEPGPEGKRKILYSKTNEEHLDGRLHQHAIFTMPKAARRWPKCNDRGRRRHGLPLSTEGQGSLCYCGGPPKPGCPPGCECRVRYCLQALAHHHGFGWVDIRRIKPNTANYTTKYVNKQTNRPRPRYCRVYTYSPGWAQGLTLRSIHQAWIRKVAARYPRPDPWAELDLADFATLVDVGIGHHRPRPPPPPGEVVDPRTGEIRPAGTRHQHPVQPTIH